LETALNLIGTFVFAVSGALLGVRKRFDLVGIAVLAQITALGGGILRDVLANELPAVFRSDSERYAVPAILGATIVVVAGRLGLYGLPVATGAALVVFALRLLALRRGWHAPRPRLPYRWAVRRGRDRHLTRSACGRDTAGVGQPRGCNAPEGSRPPRRAATIHEGRTVPRRAPLPMKGTLSRLHGLRPRSPPPGTGRRRCGRWFPSALRVSSSPGVEATRRTTR